jgi:pyroglutamyl-peptidase
MKRVLLTGFEPFAGSSMNPSEQIVKALAASGIVDSSGQTQVELHTAVLPVVFTESSELLKHLIKLHQPDIVICLGQAEGRREISFERVAINLDDARLADNAGRTITDQPVVEGGQPAHFTTLPVKEMVAAVRAEGIAAGLSTTAGTFVCNHIFYALQHSLIGTGKHSGFIHVPLIEEQAGEFEGQPTMPLEQQVEAIGVAIRVAAGIHEA